MYLLPAQEPITASSKPLMQAVEQSEHFTLYIYISGMHLLEKYGGTYHEVIKDGYSHVQVAFGQHFSDSMSYNTGNVICDLTGYVNSIQPAPDRSPRRPH